MALTYESSGVDYGPLDAFKRSCQRAAASTVGALKNHDLTEPANVRGESAYLLESPDEFLAHVEEGLGTKNLVADAMLELTGKSFYANIGIDTVATIVNDLVTTGALPISVAMHSAVGDSAWFANTARADDLARGFAEDAASPAPSGAAGKRRPSRASSIPKQSSLPAPLLAESAPSQIASSETSPTAMPLSCSPAPAFTPTA